MLHIVQNTINRTLSTILGSRKNAEKSSLSFSVSENTNRKINDLLDKNIQVNRGEMLRNMFRLHDALIENVDKKCKFHLRDTDGNLEPFVVGAGPIDEIDDDRTISVNVLMNDRSRTRLRSLVNLNGCRDPNDYLVHALNDFITAVAAHQEDKVMVREMPDGTFEDYRVFY